MKNCEWTTQPDTKAPHLAWVVKVDGKSIEVYNRSADSPRRAKAVATFLNDFAATHPETR